MKRKDRGTGRSENDFELLKMLHERETEKEEKRGLRVEMDVDAFIS